MIRVFNIIFLIGIYVLVLPSNFSSRANFSSWKGFSKPHYLIYTYSSRPTSEYLLHSEIIEFLIIIMICHIIYIYFTAICIIRVLYRPIYYRYILNIKNIYFLYMCYVYVNIPPLWHWLKTKIKIFVLLLRKFYNKIYSWLTLFLRKFCFFLGLYILWTQLRIWLAEWSLISKLKNVYWYMN